MLEQRSTLKQEETRIILRQLVKGIRDFQEHKIVHRDMKLANILLHFPNKPQLEGLTKSQKKSFLRKVDLTQVEFQVKISDFGLSTILDGAQSQQSIVGTPLYQSPQVLKRKCYNDTVDTWALGVMLFELLVGVTPFHCFELRDLVRKINDGRYKLCVQGEHIKIETCLFLLDTLQTIENNRVSVGELLNNPFISEEFSRFALHNIDKAEFEAQ